MHVSPNTGNPLIVLIYLYLDVHVSPNAENPLNQSQAQSGISTEFPFSEFVSKRKKAGGPPKDGPTCL